VLTGRHEGGSSLHNLANLPQDDFVAIEQLRRMIEQETDPLSRHFTFAELEHRLYHSRDVLSSALSEYDATCHAHDREMEDAIRPALLA
jgi:hypothetical protein